MKHILNNKKRVLCIVLVFCVFFAIGAAIPFPDTQSLSWLFAPSMTMAKEDMPPVNIKLPAKEELLFSASMAAFSGTKKEAPAVPAPTAAPLPTPAGTLTVVRGNTAAQGIQINNETSYDVSGITPIYAVPPTDDKPKVLIIHTHTSEAYMPSEAYGYTPTDVDRTEDTSYNVARVGKELADTLKAAGINAIHDDTINDYPSYNGSYKKSMDLITWYLNEYPSIEYVFDVHRDAIVQSNGTKLAAVCEIDGRHAAQIMLVVGTDQGGLYNPQWRENFARASALQKIFNSRYENFARPLNLRKERFNGHLSTGHMIIEVGTTGNTLDQALVSARAAGECIAEYILCKTQ